MRSALAGLLLIGCTGSPSAPRRYEVGHPLTEQELAAVDAPVFPSGRGLPHGRGTARQGKPLYAALCASCHGPNAEGRDDYPALVGGRGTLASASPVLTVGSYWPYATTVWDYVQRAMPYVAPGALTDDQVYALTAFLLHANGIIGEDAVVDETTLPRVAMPNRDGFVADPRPDVRP